MTRRRWRSAAVFAVVAVAGLLPLTACEPRVGVAAYVGDTRISDARVQQLVDEGLSDPDVREGVQDVAAYRQMVLSRLIKHELITGAARRLGVRVTEGEMAQVLASEQQRAGGRDEFRAALARPPLGVPPSQIRSFFRDLVLLDEIGTELSKDVTFTEAELREFYQANGGPETGQTFEQLRPRVIEVMRSRRAQQEAANYLRSYLRDVPVKVNPRYGRFDPSKLSDPRQAPVLAPTRDDFFRADPDRGGGEPSAPRP